MSLTGIGKLAKILLIGLNVVIWIGSLVIFGLGIWGAADKPYLEEVLSEDIYLSAAYILIVVGIIAFLLAFLGIYGAFKENRSVLLGYSILVLIMFIILLVGGIMAASFYNKAESKFKEGMKNSLGNYEEDSGSTLTMAWDDAQKYMECCGISSYRDWQEENNNYNSVKEIPKSCCINQTRLQEDQIARCTNTPTKFNAYVEGCYVKIQMSVGKHSQAIAGVGIAVALLLLFSLILAIVLYFMIGKEEPTTIAE